MLIITVLVATLFLCLLVFVFWFATQSQRRTLSDLAQRFERTQDNILLLQKEFEKAQEAKATQLRSEIQQGMQGTRQELQQSLTKSGLEIETRVSKLDEKIEKRLDSVSANVQEKLEKNLKEGFLHFEKVQQHLSLAGKQLENLNHVGKSITDLNNLLKLPHLRGGFGEASLERILSDLLPVSAFELQYQITPNSPERVDAIVKYPNAVLPIDSKFPREQVLPLFETDDPAALVGARKQLGEVMKVLAKQIREKYIKPESGTTEMALLFVPSETLYFEILRNPSLCDELSQKKIFAVSPNTLAVTLHAISMAREYYEMAKGIESTITEVKKAQKHFDNFEKKFEGIGTGLQRAQDAFATASTHLNRYSGAVGRLISNAESLPIGPESTKPPELNA